MRLFYAIATLLLLAQSANAFSLQKFCYHAGQALGGTTQRMGQAARNYSQTMQYSQQNLTNTYSPTGFSNNTYIQPQSDIQFTSGGNTNLSTMRMGNMTTTSGYVGNQPVSTMTNNFGNMSMTSGYIGNRSISATQNQFGKMGFSNGYIGNQPFNYTSTQFGPNMTTVNGYQGGKFHNYTINNFGGMQTVTGY